MYNKIFILIAILGATEIVFIVFIGLINYPYTIYTLTSYLQLWEEDFWARRDSVAPGP